MALPIILGAAAAIAAAAGVGSGVRGSMKMKEANDTLKSAQSQSEKNNTRLEIKNKVTTKAMDLLGKKELKILNSFEEFSDVFEKIQNKPNFKSYEKDGVKLPKYNPDEIEKVSIGAGVLLGGLGGATAGAAGGFAAAGATTAAVMALGTASTGTAIASLSGVAATNATLAAIGGGALAIGGGGMALGTTILGAATLGIGLLVGGVIFSITGSTLSDKADEASLQVRNAEKKINKIITYLDSLKQTAVKYNLSLSKADDVYRKHLSKLKSIVDIDKKTNWTDFTSEEKLITENTVLLVSLLYNMCKVQLVVASESETEVNEINYEKIEDSTNNADIVLGQVAAFSNM